VVNLILPIVLRMLELMEAIPIHPLVWVEVAVRSLLQRLVQVELEER
jgi:hypothetical protein